MRSETYEENEFPIAYLLTVRTYGTWLHGDNRGSITRNGKVLPGSFKLEPNVPLLESMRDAQRQPSVTLDEYQRELVRLAIAEVCDYRKYILHAVNVRTNHAHTVISKPIKPEKIVNDLKAYSTRKPRERWQFGISERVWSPGRKHQISLETSPCRRSN
jgi:hypothetical protein